MDKSGSSKKKQKKSIAMFRSYDEPLQAANEFAEDADVHGVKQVTRSENGLARRVLWGLLLIGALVVLIYNTQLQIRNFLAYNHTTLYDIEFVHDLDFPAVTICNVNKHKRSEFTELDIAVMGPHLGMTDDNINLLHAEMYPQDWVNDMFNGTDWNSTLSGYNLDDYDIADFYNRTAHRREDMIQYCTWKGHPCADESWVVSYTHYSKCYTFNSKGDHTLLKAGAGNGLKLVLYDEQHEYIESSNAEDLGFKWLAHDPIEPPFLKEMGFGIAPGYHYLLALREREIKGLGPPYTECVWDHDTSYYDHYTVSGCRIQCETDMIVSNCSCKLVESPGDHSVCTVENFDCAEATLLAIEESDTCLCQNPCRTIQYPHTMSLLELREDTVFKLQAEHNVSANLAKHELAVLNIYFDSMSFELIEQVPAYTWLDILSDFGGTMGLWLGASVLAAAQILDYLLMACFTKCNKKTASQSSVNPEKTEKNEMTQVA